MTFVKKEKCPQGHPYKGDNVIVRRHGRGCRTCQREASLKYDRAHRAEKSAYSKLHYLEVREVKLAKDRRRYAENKMKLDWSRGYKP